MPTVYAKLYKNLDIYGPARMGNYALVLIRERTRGMRSILPTSSRDPSSVKNLYKL